MAVTKPKCKLTDENGNIFNLIGKASQALKCEGQREEAAQMISEAMSATSYDEALQVIMRYVEVE